nr:unnamed protein product [Digitaria exilis]
MARWCGAWSSHAGPRQRGAFFGDERGGIRASGGLVCGHALDEKTLSTTLYLQQTFDQDQRTLATDTVIINWVLKDGPDAGANTIGHAEGLTTHANLAKNWWVTIMDMVFDGGRYEFLH